MPSKAIEIQDRLGNNLKLQYIKLDLLNNILET